MRKTTRRRRMGKRIDEAEERERERLSAQKKEKELWLWGVYL